MSDAAGTARLFAALELPAQTRARLGAWAASAARRDPALRAVAPDALHLTLHFLGERPAGEIPALAAAIRAAPDDAVRLSATGALWLAPRRPHVLTCGFAPCDGLTAVHLALAASLEHAAPGWRRDRRPLRPHVTVARVRRGASPDRRGLPACPPVDLEATAVLLVRSRLGPTGARYETLERRPLRCRA